MTRDETVARFLECEAKRISERVAALAAGKSQNVADEAGHAAAKKLWNDWANGLIAGREAMEADGRWKKDAKNWRARANADFSSCVFFNKDAVKEEKKTEAKAAQEEIAASANIKPVYVDAVSARFDGFVFPGRVSFTDAAFSIPARFDDAIFANDARFERAAFSDAQFERATFSADALFDNAAFSGGAKFDSAKFNGGASFDKAVLAGDASFDGVEFKRDASFNGAAFSSDAHLAGAVFSNAASFTKAAFSGYALFDSATFSGDAQFDAAAFSDASFGGAKFLQDARFYKVAFWGYAWFGSATFSRGVEFPNAVFSGEARFDDALFEGHVRFDSAIFSGNASFDRAKLKGCSNFRAIRGKRGFSMAYATLDALPDFVQAHFDEAPRLDNLEVFARPATARDKAEEPLHDFPARWRALKRLAIQGHDANRALEFHTREIQSERYVSDWPLPRNHKEASGVLRFYAGWIYQIFSNSGRSLFLPAAWWILTILIAAIYYLGQQPNVANNRADLYKQGYPRVGAYILAGYDAIHNDQGCYSPPSGAQEARGGLSKDIANETNAPWEALQLAFRNGALVLDGDSVPAHRTYGCLYGFELENNRAIYAPLNVSIASALQKLFSAVFIFLFGLALRNMLKVQ